MKRLGLTPLLIAATLFLGGRLAADEARPAVSPNLKPEASAPAMGPMRGADLLKRFDKNGDGKLDEDEQADAHEAMLKEQMGRQAAKAAAPDGGEQHRKTMLEMFDKNHDGRLDDDERAEARKYAAEHGPGVSPAELVKRFDRDGDGKLNVEEVAGLMAFLREMRAPNAPSISPSTKAEMERLDRVAAEVARRRELREQAAKETGARPAAKP